MTGGQARHEAVGATGGDVLGPRPGRDLPTMVVADDEPDVVYLLERLLADEFRIVATASDGEAAVEAVSTSHPDVVLLDLTMPRLDGQSALPRILRHAPNTMVAILSAFLDDERVQRLLLDGAFAAYEKTELRRVPMMLREDLARFRRVLAGEDDVPAWKHRLQLS